MSQGALFSMAIAASRDLEETDVRFNELFLSARVEYDSDAEKHGLMKASDFARAYEQILARPEVKGCRVSVYGHEDLGDLKFKKKVDVWEWMRGFREQ